jgi:NADH pyrophosphatase NudC (nudix superfamily)
MPIRSSVFNIYLQKIVHETILSQMKNSHCSHCGSKFENTDWPRVCVNRPACGALAWENPTPVVVVLQPVQAETTSGELKSGAMIGLRAIEPARGQWSLISGFMEVGETAEEGARREFREETGLDLKGEPVYAYSRYNETGLLMLCYIASEPMRFEEFLQGRPCAENEQLGVRWIESNFNLAFPLQSEFFDKWVAGDFRR